MTHTLGIIGCGNMGAAILRGALHAGVLAASDVVVAEPDADKRSKLADTGCAIVESAKDIVNVQQIMLAVKPQAFATVAEAIAPLPQPTVVISIMAGLSSATIRKALGENARIVRAMPNTPAQLGLGMTALAVGDGATEADLELATKLFEAVGRVLRVDEIMMYAITAVSGSGPAYIFLLAEAMQQGAEQMGLSHADARTLVAQTVRGAGELLAQSELTATDLRQAVTSPGGTTAAALEHMFEKELPEIVTEALAAARDRGIELDQATA